MSVSTHWIWTGLMAIGLLGCQQSRSTSVSTAPSPPPTKPTSEESATKAPAPTVRLGSWTDVEQYVASQSGKVVVLDVWSTWCAPCLREFPQLVALQQKYASGVTAVSLNCNFAAAEGEKPSDIQSEVEAFLEKQRASFVNFISSTPDEELLKTLGAASIPIVRVYGKDGRLRKQFSNDENEYGEEGFTYANHIEPLVKQLLAE